MPKCFRLLNFIEWTGDNLSAIQDFVVQWVGQAQYSNNNGTLTIEIPGVPTRIVDVGGVLVTPYIESYPSMAVFEQDYGVVGG